mmetsp:Transcript_11234/g.17018  ORF Transcript_11234/g.17018 Transcript_11234/m.17018 type:complete len:132 (-) Transcript_11234:178-573(-)
MAKMKLFVTIERDPCRLLKLYLRADFMWDIIPILPIDIFLSMNKPFNRVIFIAFKLLRLRNVFPYLFRPPRTSINAIESIITKLPISTRTAAKLTFSFLRLLVAVASASMIAGMLFVVFSEGMFDDQKNER